MIPRYTYYKSRNRTTRSTILRLQRAIDKLGQWFRLWRIEVNPEKSAAIQFKYSKRRNKFVVDYDTPNLKMLNARIPWQQSYKYLGVTLDRNLLFRDHIVRVKKTALSSEQAQAMLGLEPSTQLIDGPLEVRTDVALGSAAQIEGGVVGEQRQPDA
ncbi:RNA-directed DNA polymerase from mobile element jockey [Eumeta japonica]|uniref:RNA-directed DNA polymerase from mobile element jockey n=1 Tax=Eumeta variegata TaxID=151549 RepID=A0A4C1ZQ69_EUMVA|nr:RNA-directed DNA polymerase from mobile element jockey [Eumeta japonica]